MRPTWTARKTLVGFLAIGLCAFSMWYFVERVWAPPTGMRFSDLYPRWLGSRELLLHGRSPYSPEVTREIQLWSWGYALERQDPTHIRDEDRFAYPVYIAFLLAPTVKLPFVTVYHLFGRILPCLALLTAWLWLRMMRLPNNLRVLGSLLPLAVCNFPVLESIHLQQPVLLAAALLAGAGLAIARERYFIGGILLAISTVKPQAVGLITAWLLLWAIAGWRTRKRLVMGFALTLAALVGASERLLPGWIPQFLDAVRAYQSYTGNISVIRLYFGRAGVVVTACLLVALGLVLWKLRDVAASSPEFNFAFCLTTIVGIVVAPTLYPTAQVLLLPAFFFLIKHANTIRELGAGAALVYAATVLLLLWQWVGSSAFLIAHMVAPLAVLSRFWIVPLAPLLLVPTAALLTFGLCVPHLVRHPANLRFAE